VDPAVCECGDNVAISSAAPCACGTLTYYEGFCCNGAWNAEEISDCSDNPGDAGPSGDTSDNPGAEGDTVGSYGSVNRTTERVFDASGGGCSLSTADRTTGPVTVLGIFLLFALLAIRSKTTPVQPAPPAQS